MNSTAFDVSLAVVGTLALAIRLIWRHDPRVYLKLGAIAANLWALSIGLYYSFAETWRLGLVLWIAVLGADVVLALAIWVKSRQGRNDSIARKPM